MSWIRVNGVAFEGRQTIIRNLPEFGIAELRPEPDNAYDPQAVAVFICGVKVGYAPKGTNLPAGRLQGNYKRVGGGPSLTSHRRKTWGLRVFFDDDISGELPNDLTKSEGI